MEIIVIGVVLLLLYEVVKKAQTASGVSSAGDGGKASDALDNVTQAIFQFEGAGKPGATNAWNNNPGNIGGGQRTFADVGDGWTALTDWVQSHAAQHPSWDFYDLFSYYLNGNTDGQVTAQGDPNTYAEYVAGYVGVDPTQSVAQTLGYPGG
jgi:hypothetical protein